MIYIFLTSHPLLLMPDNKRGHVNYSCKQNCRQKSTAGNAKL